MSALKSIFLYLLGGFVLHLLLLPPPTSSQAPGVAPLEEYEYLDPTCKNTTLPKRWRYLKWHEDLETTKLYDRSTRFPSYVGYPCSVELYKDFYTRIQNKLLTCPFTKGLERQFEEYKLTLYNNSGNLTIQGRDKEKPLPVNATDTLVFQYVCFSRQWEECVAIPGFDKAKNNGSCNGICQCLKKVPVEPNLYPKKPSNNPKWDQYDEKIKHAPNQTLQLGVRCGVKAGGICFSRWDSLCSSITDSNLEKDYRPRDLYFQCESNAGCHEKERVCRCAIGHECEGDKGVGYLGGGECFSVISTLGMVFMIKFLF